MNGNGSQHYIHTYKTYNGTKIKNMKREDFFMFKIGGVMLLMV